MIDILKGTPWWVFLISGYLLSIGVRSLKPRIVPLRRLFILPAFLLLWGMGTLVTKLQSLPDIALWIGFVCIGTIVGWKLASHLKMKADKKKGLISIPGSPLILILVLCIFSTKYFFGYTYATDPSARYNMNIVTLDLLSSGLITGIFLGRVLHVWRLWKSAKHSTLKT